MDAYAAIGSAARLFLLAFKGLPSFYEVQAPRLAIQDQPSPSKPIIPSLHTDYTTFRPSLQAKAQILLSPHHPLGYNVRHAVDTEEPSMRQTLWTVLGILSVLLGMAYSEPILAHQDLRTVVPQTHYDTASAPTPTPLPVEPTQLTTRTTILLPNMGSTGSGPAAPPFRQSGITIGIVATILVAGAAFVWGGKKRRRSCGFYSRS